MWLIKVLFERHFYINVKVQWLPAGSPCQHQADKSCIMTVSLDFVPYVKLLLYSGTVYGLCKAYRLLMRETHTVIYAAMRLRFPNMTL